MSTLEFIVVDTNAFSYLHNLNQLALLQQVAVCTGKVAVTKAVIKQLHRGAGQLGTYVQSLCDREEVLLFSPKQGDAISREVANVLRSADGNLVRKNRVDIELVELARARDGGVLTCENGIRQLARRRNVTVLDLLDLFSWAIQLELVSQEYVDTVTTPWSSPSASGMGAPVDFCQSFSYTSRTRQTLPQLLAELPGPR